MMLLLKKFTITNYRSCLKSTLHLENNLTCLIGINGVGKTNLLNGIQLLKKIKGGKNKFLDNTSRVTAGSHTSIAANFEYDGKNIRLKCDINYETDDRNHDDILNANLKFNLNEITGSKSWISFPTEIFQYLEHVNWNSNVLRSHYFNIIKVSSKEVDIIKVIQAFIKRISYYSASQFSDPTKCPISFELDESKQFRSGRFNYYHERFLYDLYINYKTNRKLFNKFLTTVNKEGIGIIDHLTFGEYEMPSSIYEVKSGGKIRKVEKNRQLIIPSVTIDNIELSPNQLSEGTFKTLALIFYIITDENDLLLIEEPEVCVHHGLLNSIISLILSHSTKKQIIISTHSDFVLDRLKPSNLLIVTKEIKRGTVAQSLSKALSRNDYMVLKKYLSETGNLGEYWKEGGFENE